MKRLMNSAEVASPYEIFYFQPKTNTETNVNTKKSGLDSQTPLPSENKLLQIHSNNHEKLTTSLSPNNSRTLTESQNKPIVVSIKDSAMLQSLLEKEDFESGIENPSERYFQELFIDNHDSTMNMLSKLFLDNYSTDGRKVNILVGILHIVSHKTYHEIFPIGQTLALAALSHKDNEVAEYGIKCFENWGNADGINKLSAVEFSTSWLCDYANQVIMELREGD